MVERVSAKTRKTRLGGDAVPTTYIPQDAQAGERYGAVWRDWLGWVDLGGFVGIFCRWGPVGDFKKPCFIDGNDWSIWYIDHSGEHVAGPV
jgi:hypothetical protein